MESKNEDVEIDCLERGLLSDSDSDSESGRKHEGDWEAADDDDDDDDESVIYYRAYFEEMEENFVKYRTAQWILYSLLLILAWGIGFFMLLYLPVRRFIFRKDIRSRKLYVTPNAIVYKVHYLFMPLSTFSLLLLLLSDIPFCCFCFS